MAFWGGANEYLVPLFASSNWYLGDNKSNLVIHHEILGIKLPFFKPMRCSLLTVSKLASVTLSLLSHVYSEGRNIRILGGLDGFFVTCENKT